MNAWRTDFQIKRGLPSLPRMLRIGGETVTTPRYRHTAGPRRGFPYCTFQYTLRGRGLFADATGQYDVAPGCGFLFNSQDLDWAYRYPENAPAPWEFVYAEFSGGNVVDVSRELIARNGHLFRFEPHSRVIRRFLRFANPGWKTFALGAAEAAELCLDLVLKLTESAQKRRKEMPAPLFSSVLAAIDARLGSSVSVDELAREQGMTREHFSRLFLRETGLSPHQYIMRQKIRLACHLLRTTPLACKVIAERIGDPSPAHFSRLFRQLTGTTPKTFREGNIAHPLF